jgi:hypothetical protein
MGRTLRFYGCSQIAERLAAPLRPFHDCFTAVMMIPM